MNLKFWRKAPAVPLPRRATRKFDGAHIGRLTDKWLATSASIDRELRGDLDLLRSRSRELSRNNEYARKFLCLVRNNIVGPTGFTLQSKVEDNPGKLDSIGNMTIEAGFSKWGRKGISDITGVYSFADIQRTLAMTAARDGEILVRIVRGRAAGNAFGFALQLLDIDRLNTTLNREQSKNTNAIIMGVEVNKYRRPVAYWIFTNHPNGMSGSSRAMERVPAANIIHAFVPDEVEQTRGVPWIHASMRRLHDLGGYREAAIIAARVGAAKVGFFTTPDGDGGPASESKDDKDGLITEAEPGTFNVLPEGYSFESFNPDYPHQQFDMFSKSCLRGIASGMLVSYNSLSSDLEGVNFSSIRSGVLEERDAWMVLQNWFAEAVITPIYEDWLSTSLLAGALTLPNGSAMPAAKVDKFTTYTFQGRRWTWVDPKKDIEASLLAINNGLSSPQRVASQMGVDIEDVLSELKKFQDMVTAKGVVLDKSTPAQPLPQPSDN